MPEPPHKANVLMPSMDPLNTVRPGQCRGPPRGYRPSSSTHQRFNPTLRAISNIDSIVLPALPPAVSIWRDATPLK